MHSQKSTFLLAITATFALGLTTGAAGFAAAPKPDAPETPPQKAKPVTVQVQPKRSTKRTRVIIRRADRAVPTGLKVTVIDEPNLQDGTISVVTEQDEFATIATGMGTRIARGTQTASLGNIHTGYTLRCQGAWDQDGFQYQANRIALGETKRDTDVIARVNAACENIGKARKGGGFGKSLVAMLPPSVNSQAVSVGGQPYVAPAPAVEAPIPAEGITPQRTTPAPTPTEQPAAPAPVNPAPPVP